MDGKTGAIIPVFNAADTLGKVVAGLQKSVANISIITVNDGSTVIIEMFAKHFSIAGNVFSREVRDGKQIFAANITTRALHSKPFLQKSHFSTIVFSRTNILHFWAWAFILLHLW